MKVINKLPKRQSSGQFRRVRVLNVIDEIGLKSAPLAISPSLRESNPTTYSYHLLSLMRHKLHELIIYHASYISMFIIHSRYSFVTGDRSSTQVPTINGPAPIQIGRFHHIQQLCIGQFFTNALHHVAQLVGADSARAITVEHFERPPELVFDMGFLQIGCHHCQELCEISERGKSVACSTCRSGPGGPSKEKELFGNKKDMRKRATRNNE